MTVRIAPSILSADFGHLADEIARCEAGGADWIHIDVMDGCFVPNLTYGAKVIETVRRLTNLPLDVHLMVVEPEKYLESFASAGASVITVHQEAAPTCIASCSGSANSAAGPAWRSTRRPRWSTCATWSPTSTCCSS